MRDWWKRLFYGGGIAALFASASFTVYCAWNVYAYPRLEKEQVRENANEAYHFVLVPEELDNDYWRLVEKGAKAAAKELGVDLEYIGPRQANIDEHLRILKKAAAAKVDGIITQGLTKADFVPVIDEIADKGIPVVTVDTDAPTSRRAAYVGTDNYYAGFIAGRALVEDTRGAVNVAIITGSFDGGASTAAGAGVSRCGQTGKANSHRCRGRVAHYACASRRKGVYDFEKAPGCECVLRHERA
ncbi:Autoinducer 2-binding protein LsrB precursor [Geobacillus sp. BCO2]|nr:Autoinducer 2-binding protein LsrB precursor [Geobacillus sp. BCO2]